MGSILKPNNIKSEANYIMGSYSGGWGTPSNLFDNNASNYYEIGIGHWFEITFNEKVNIWIMSPNNADGSTNNSLWSSSGKIQYYDSNNVLQDYNGKIEKWKAPAATWSLGISNLPKGKYRFSKDSTDTATYCEWTEWYIEKGITKEYLIQDKSSVFYTFNGKNIIKSPLQTLDDNNFKTNGFDNIKTITEEQWNEKFPNKSDAKILIWTNDMDKQEAKLTYECEPFQLTDWLKKDECKLLVYTDDLDKKECEMIYNCKPYTPIDILKKNGDICNILVKEV